MSKADDSRTAVRFDGVHMVFNRGLKPPVWALRGLDLSVPEGSVLGLLGPNGSGKTTAFSCLLGLLHPQAGSIERLGERVVAASTGHRWGVLLEDTRLPPFLSVHHALGYVCALRGLDGAASRTELERVIELCRIRDLLDRTTAVLSKGQARRVGLAAALIGDPPLLVLDEPSAGLDAEARVEFEQLVRGLRDGRRTLLIASHLLGDVEATCTHIAVMQDGRVLLAGPADALLAAAHDADRSDVHVDAARVAELDALGLQHTTSVYAGLLLLITELPDVEVFARLAHAGIPPRRVQPRVSILSLYLSATHPDEESRR